MSQCLHSSRSEYLSASLTVDRC